jgi:DNA polymerase III alpha subunit
MKGRAALKDVLRAHSAVSAAEMNEITKFFPEQSKIADDLQEMKEETGDSSIILWKLQNDKKGELRQWCYLDDNGQFCGPLGKHFEQAIRLEGTKSAQSRHPAGVVISPIPLDKICPMVYDTKSKQVIAGLEMTDIERLGLIKYDILSLSLLDKISGILSILRTGFIENGV